MIELGEYKQSIHGTVRMSCQDRQEFLRDMGYSKIILSHFGEFSIDFISDISERVELYMTSAGDSKNVIKRMFTILIEGMKNIRQHGLRDERGRQLGYLLIAQSQDSYLLEVANLVDKDDFENLLSYVEKINLYDQDMLVQKYNEALDREFLNIGSGSGLGLIVTRIKTGNQIKLIRQEINDQLVLCSFGVDLNRK